MTNERSAVTVQGTLLRGVTTISPEDAIRIITERRLREFWEKHPDSEGPLKAWRALVRAGSYQTPSEVKGHFGSADFLGGNVTVFDIGGNKYRLVVSMRYDLQRVYIRHVLTHKEYDRKVADGTL